MTVLVTGGRGTFGRLLVPRLMAAGHDVIVTSRSGREAPPGTELRTLDLAASRIHPDVLAGVHTVVHAASNPARTKHVDVQGTERLLLACARADVKHFVYLSIVGIDDHPFPYYRAKVAAERLITASAVPYTIFRVTQFHEFLDRIFGAGPVITVFRGLSFQVIDGGVVADRTTELVAGNPSGRIPDLGGPQAEDMRSMASRWKSATRSRKPIVTLPVFGKVARAFREQRHHTSNSADGTPTFDDWLASL